MATQGKFAEYNPKRELEVIHRVDANVLHSKGCKRCWKTESYRLSSCGPSTYQQIKDVLSPEAPGTVSFADIVQKMTEYFQPLPSEIIQRYRFNARVRQPHETVSTYIA